MDEPIDYVRNIVDRFGDYLARRGVTAELNPAVQVLQILSYIDMRWEMSGHDIAGPSSTPVSPAGWTADDERIWRDWIHYHCSLYSWQSEVMDPVFGTMVEPWEPRGTEWRDELLHYMQWWIRRSRSIVAKFDPSPIEEEENDIDPARLGKGGVDQYLLDHGTGKQRRKIENSSFAN